MRYKLRYPEALLVFEGNAGKALLEASTADLALLKARRLFPAMREERVEPLGQEQFGVIFKVRHDYKAQLLRAIDKTRRLVRSQRFYDHARYIDRYIIASIKRLTGQPDWLTIENLNEEVRALRQAAVVARELSDISRFLDWDICIANYVDLNVKTGHKSRVVRTPRVES